MVANTNITAIKCHLLKSQLLSVGILANSPCLNPALFLASIYAAVKPNRILNRSRVRPDETYGIGNARNDS